MQDYFTLLAGEILEMNACMCVKHHHLIFLVSIVILNLEMQCNCIIALSICLNQCKNMIHDIFICHYDASRRLLKMNENEANRTFDEKNIACLKLENDIFYSEFEYAHERIL